MRDPVFRAEASIDLSGDEVTSLYPPSALRDFWRRVLSDLTTTETARSLNKKEQRASYVDTLADVRPPPEARRPRAPLSAEPATFGAVPAAPPRRPATRVQRPRPARLFQGLTLRNVSLKARDILREAQQIDLTKFPNAGAVLIRVLVELVADEAVEYYQLSLPDRLRERLQACLHKLDPTNRDDQYASVRRAINDPNSPLGVRSMQAYLHNPYMQPDAASLRALSENYVPLLTGLDAAIGSGQQP